MLYSSFTKSNKNTKVLKPIFYPSKFEPWKVVRKLNHASPIIIQNVIEWNQALLNNFDPKNINDITDIRRINNDIKELVIIKEYLESIPFRTLM
jgi:hypothetical protein